MIRVAASADLHFGPDSEGTLRPCLDDLEHDAHVLLLAGDLTKSGERAEAEVLARELHGAPVPVVAVLGNHDYHSDRHDQVRGILEDAGVTVLEGERIVIEVDGLSLGIAGAKGFGGGFTGSSGTEFGEPEMKAFIRHSRTLASRLEDALLDVRDADVRIALMHYSPVRETLQGEPPEIFPFLGTYLLAEAVDHAGADLALHGHAHHGSEKGVTPAGVNVRNVAMPVIRQPYAVFTFDGERTQTSARPAALVDRAR